MSNWDNLVGRFEEHQDHRTKIDLNRFISKYLVLFNHRGATLDAEEAAELLREYRLEIDPHKPVSIIENLDGVGEEKVVLRLPPMETNVPTLNECEADSSIVDALYNKLEQYSKNPIGTGVGNMVSSVAEQLADTAVNKLIENDEYSEVMGEIEKKLDETTPEVVDDGDIEWE